MIGTPPGSRLSGHACRFDYPASHRHHFRQPEIQNFRVPFLRNEDVRWLDVTVHDASRMRGVQRVGDLPSESTVSTSNGFPAICAFKVIPSRSPFPVGKSWTCAPWFVIDMVSIAGLNSSSSMRDSDSYYRESAKKSQQT